MGILSNVSKPRQTQICFGSKMNLKGLISHKQSIQSIFLIHSDFIFFRLSLLSSLSHFIFPFSSSYSRLHFNLFSFLFSLSSSFSVFVFFFPLLYNLSFIFFNFYLILGYVSLFLIVFYLFLLLLSFSFSFKYDYLPFSILLSFQLFLIFFIKIMPQYFFYKFFFLFFIFFLVL